MAGNIKFRFVDLPYQIDAVNSVVNLFKGQSKQTGDSLYREVRRGEISGSWVGKNPRFEIGSARIMKNLNAVQTENRHLLPDDVLDPAYNFTVDMETGTGKTYVYLRTILELHKQYGFTKFMIIVPRIAILQGVKKSIEQLSETFKALYDGLDINARSFVYNSANLNEMQNFIESTELSIVILNKDSFNKKKKTGKKKTENVLHQEREGSPSFWQRLKEVKPIVIIDEPQLIEGDKKKKSATLTQLEELNPLFTLRYSATHRNPYNMVYKLTSYDAYNQHLVKKIRVKTVYGEVPKDYPYIRYAAFTKDLKARIELFHRDANRGITKKQFDVLDGASLHELSGGLPQYENMFVMGNPHKIDGLTISRGKIGQLTLFNDLGESDWGITINKGAETLTLIPGDCTYNEKLRETDSAVIRVQIRTAIKSHLDTQFAILEKGKEIKALSLFFIDEVKRVRGEDGKDGVFLQIFDEEYQNLIKEPKYRDYFKKYASLFPEYEKVKLVREGYFAVDINNKAVEPERNETKNRKITFSEEDYNAKSKEDIQRGIDLILRGKEELISFSTPLAFIFSHSALREGWDNPNIFTLCTLKESNNEMAKKQEIGRGLRLPVDTQGNRCYDEDVNLLTVVANSYYDEFAAALQKDFDAQHEFDKDTATEYEFFETLRRAGIPTEKITKELAKTLKTELKHSLVINSNGKLLPKGDIQKVSFRDAVLAEHETAVKEAFIEVMQEKGTRKIIIENGDEAPEENTPHSYMNEEAFKSLLNELTLRLEKRTFYSVDIDSDLFIEEAGRHLNRFLTNKSEITQNITVGSGIVEMKESGKTVVHEQTTDYVTDKTPLVWQKKSDFQIINYIMTQTRLPRHAIYRILMDISDELREYLRMQDVLDLVSQELKKLLTNCKSQHVTGYHVIDNYLFDEKEIFIPDTIDNETLQYLNLENAVLDGGYKTKAANRRAMYKYYKTDSRGEREFAQQLDEDENVMLFTKLHKGGFVIDTPEGNYSPDWAVIYKHPDETVNLYFIVETKINKERKDLSDVEKTKIRCGEMHFEAVSKSLGKQVGYFYAKNYRDFKTQVEERGNSL